MGVDEVPSDKVVRESLFKEMILKMSPGGLVGVRHTRNFIERGPNKFKGPKIGRSLVCPRTCWKLFCCSFMSKGERIRDGGKDRLGLDLAEPCKVWTGVV